MKNLKNCTNAPIADILVMLFELLPPKLVREISALGRLRRDFPLGLSEIRVRAEGRCSMVISAENVLLSSHVSATELREVYDKALGGALYIHEGELRRGFLSMPRGVRVGISASGEGGALPTDISSLVFRLPSAPSENAGAIYSIWQKEMPRGTLIYSTPGAGKTSALRALAMLISRESALRVAVVDERREFVREDYSGCLVDILSGCKKAEGIEIAMRTLTPEVIIVDEIGSLEEAESLIAVGRGGVPIIATAHAASFEELIGRAPIRALCENGYFELFIRLERVKNSFSFEAKYYKDFSRCISQNLHF